MEDEDVRLPVGLAKELVENVNNKEKSVFEIIQELTKEPEVVSANLVSDTVQAILPLENEEKPEIQEINIDDCIVFDISDVAVLTPVVLNIQCKMKDSKEMMSIGLPGFVNKDSGIFLTLEGTVINAEGFDYHLKKMIKEGKF